jgi:tripartite-type tricarboxylate transporter receptor subunit TctC
MTWSGLFVRAGTPPAIIARLHQDFARVLNLPEIKARLAQDGEDVVADTPAEFLVFLKSEIAKVKALSKIADIKIE